MVIQCRIVANVFLKDISNFFKNLNTPIEFAEFNLTLKLSDEIYVTDQNNVTQTLISSHLYCRSSYSRRYGKN